MSARGQGEDGMRPGKAIGFQPAETEKMEISCLGTRTVTLQDRKCPRRQSGQNLTKVGAKSEHRGPQGPQVGVTAASSSHEALV